MPWRHLPFRQGHAAPPSSGLPQKADKSFSATWAHGMAPGTKADRQHSSLARHRTSLPAPLPLAPPPSPAAPWPTACAARTTRTRSPCAAWRRPLLLPGLQARAFAAVLPPSPARATGSATTAVDNAPGPAAASATCRSCSSFPAKPGWRTEEVAKSGGLEGSRQAQPSESRGGSIWVSSNPPRWRRHGSGIAAFTFPCPWPQHGRWTGPQSKVMDVSLTHGRRTAYCTGKGNNVQSRRTQRSCWWW